MITGVTVDALDPDALAAFWAAATGGRTDGLVLRFVATDSPKTVKNRVHLDLAGGHGWAAERERLLGLGARPADIGQGDVPWDVLADPEGNEFCLLRPEHPGLVVERGLAAVCVDTPSGIRPAQEAFWRTVSGWPYAEEHDWGLVLRRSADSPVALVTGPPAAPRAGRNRVRPDVVHPALPPGEQQDPAGNELLVHRR